MDTEQATVPYGHMDRMNPAPESARVSLLVCAECGATSNREVSGLRDLGLPQRRLWSRAGRCHLGEAATAMAVPYVPWSEVERLVEERDHWRGLASGLANAITVADRKAWEAAQPYVREIKRADGFNTDPADDPGVAGPTPDDKKS